MRIYVLHDEDDGRLGGAVSALADWAEEKGHELCCDNASALRLKPCIGCFGCWLKTPGSCVIRGDDGQAFVERLARSDALVILTKIPYGSFAPSIKQALDRCIPILLPFFKIHEGEMHHVQRYPWKRRILHVPYGEHDAEDFDTFAELARSHCDNVESLHVLEQVEYRGDAPALVAWAEKELAR
jgi:multimeric flavodoxin WrbA